MLVIWAPWRTQDPTTVIIWGQLIQWVLSWDTCWFNFGMRWLLIFIPVSLRCLSSRSKILIVVPLMDLIKVCTLIELVILSSTRPCSLSVWKTFSIVLVLDPSRYEVASWESRSTMKMNTWWNRLLLLDLGAGKKVSSRSSYWWWSIIFPIITWACVRRLWQWCWSIYNPLSTCIILY